MSGRRITELAVASSVDPDDLVPIVDLTGTPTTRRATLRQLVDDVPPLLAVNVRTASYTLTAGDAGRVVEMDVATANTVTIPTDAAVPYPVGTWIVVAQTDVGLTTVVGDTGVTVNNPDGFPILRGPWTSAILRKRDTDEWVMAADGPPPAAANVYTADHTLALADALVGVEMDVAGANTVTVPDNATVPFPVGAIVEVCQIGAGQTTIVEDAGVDVRTPQTLVLTGQWSTVSLRQRAVDEWVLVGDVEPL